ncbi:MAG: ATPase domain-containing protein [Thermoplasmata archaeon]
MPESPSRVPSADARVSIGNTGIDAMLEGGLVPHRPYLIVGPSGTGKTKLILQFLCEGVRHGERVLLITVEEPPNEVRLNHRGLAPELDRVEVFDAIPDVMRYERAPFKDIASVREITPFGKISPQIRRSPELSSVEVTITALEQMLRSEVARRQYSRIAVDSLTALQYFCMKGFDPVGGAQTFLRFLSDLRTTTVLTVESPLEDIETTERTLARGEIRLFRWELDGVTVRAVGVEKLRGSSHDVRLHPYRIGPNGVDVNLSVTISRDTRQIVEIPSPIVAPGPAFPASGTAPTLEPVSDEVRDLVALGIDVAPVRGAVETAIAAARAGRTEDAIQAIARISSLTGALTANVAARDSAPPSAGASPMIDAHRRIAQRADTARVGIPPTVLPPPDQLEEHLGRVLAILPVSPPPPAPAPSSVPARVLPGDPTPEPVPAPAVVPATAVEPPPTTTPPPATLAPSVPPVETARPPPSEVAVDAGRPSVPTTLVPRPAPPPAPAAVAPPTPARGAYSSVPRPVTTRPPAPSVAPAVPMPEPPPLPQALPKPTVVAPPGRPAVPLPTVPSEVPRSARASASGPVPPPLPTIASPAPTTPVAPLVSEVPEPTPKRRRRTTPPRKKAGSSGEEMAPPGGAGGEPPTEATAAKPKRRVVRKRKAPHVVGATAEPLPDAEPASEHPPTDPGAK